MPYRPKHQPQLGRGTPVPGRTRGSRDCGPRSWQMGIDARTHGDVVPGIAALRRRGGVPGPQQTNTADAKRAVEATPSGRGRRPLRYYRKGRTRDVVAAVRAGKPVHLCVDYGALNDLLQRTGDPYFRGGHSVLVAGHRKRGGTRQWLLYDPLDDGRRHGIPTGPRWVPRWKLVRAAERFAGRRGRVWAGVIAGGAHR